MTYTTDLLCSMRELLADFYIVQAQKHEVEIRIQLTMVFDLIIRVFHKSNEICFMSITNLSTQYAVNDNNISFIFACDRMKQYHFQKYYCRSSVYILRFQIKVLLTIKVLFTSISGVLQIFLTNKNLKDIYIYIYMHFTKEFVN